MTINIALTEGQEKLLKPIFETADNELGAVFAQVHSSRDSGSFMRVSFVPYNKGIEMQKALGVREGVTIGPKDFIFCEIADD